MLYIERLHSVRPARQVFINTELQQKEGEGLICVRCSGDELRVRKLLTKPRTWKVKQIS
jgi:hypothetical protein